MRDNGKMGKETGWEYRNLQMAHYIKVIGLMIIYPDKGYTNLVRILLTKVKFTRANTTTTKKMDLVSLHAKMDKYMRVIGWTAINKGLVLYGIQI